MTHVKVDDDAADDYAAADDDDANDDADDADDDNDERRRMDDGDGEDDDDDVYDEVDELMVGDARDDGGTRGPVHKGTTNGQINSQVAAKPPQKTKHTITQAHTYISDKKDTQTHIHRQRIKLHDE